jgi:Lipopolysaccharide-assembly
MLTRLVSSRVSSRMTVALAALLIASGCGYHFGASGTNLPANAQTIYVARFTNLTRQTGLNDEFMVYLKDEIARRKRLTIVETPAAADLELSGAVLQSLAVPNAFNSVLEPTQYGETLVVRAWLRDRRSNKLLWSVNQMGDTENYGTVSQNVLNTTPTFLQQNLRTGDIARMADIQTAQTQERGSRTQMMAGLAAHMYDSMATGF